jgi:hypothetical protein
MSAGTRSPAPETTPATLVIRLRAWCKRPLAVKDGDRACRQVMIAVPSRRHVELFGHIRTGQDQVTSDLNISNELPVAVRRV